jgi:hypothetical protein
MGDLITRVRAMIGDDGATETFDDDEIQAFLDQRRTDAIHAPLAYHASVTASGAIEYHDFYGRDAGAILPWEASPDLQDVSGAELDADTDEPLRGHWGFTASQLPPVYITGAFYDVNGAAALACQAWAGKVAQHFDFDTDGHGFSRSQKHAQLIAQAREFARRAVPPGRRQSSLA